MLYWQILENFLIWYLYKKNCNIYNIYRADPDFFVPKIIKKELFLKQYGFLFLPLYISGLEL